MTTEIDTDIRVHPDDDALAEAAAAEIAKLLQEAIEARGEASLALAGGGTPQPTYRKLAAAEVPWDKVHVYFGDERCVAPDHDASNYKMARAALIDPAGLHPDRVHRMAGEDPDRDAAADAYADALPERLDVLILGVGGDAHTASLFPRQDAVCEEDRLVVPVKGPKPPPWRLTITPPVIRAARRVVVLATGLGKAEAVAGALLAPDDAFNWPIQLAVGGTFFLDSYAASRIPQSLLGDEDDDDP